MNELPDYITEDEAFYYCPKTNVKDLFTIEDFIELDRLLEKSTVSSAYFNVVGQINGKNVVVI